VACRPDSRRAFAGAACAVALAATAAGCGGASNQAAARQLFDYQDQIGRINADFTQPATNQAAAVATLEQAIAQYVALQPPTKVRALHRHLVAELRAELSSLRAAQSAVAGGDAAGLAGAESRNAQARADVGRTLNHIAAVINRCRGDATKC
jgi:hypothetical protein